MAIPIVQRGGVRWIRAGQPWDRPAMWIFGFLCAQVQNVSWTSKVPLESPSSQWLCEQTEAWAAWRCLAPLAT